MADYFMQTQPLPRMSAVTPLSFTNRSQSRLNTRDGKIEELYDRFVNVNSAITIDLDQANLKMLENGKQYCTVRHNPQMIVAKLKRLENNAQINRANMELQGRKIGSTGHHAKKYCSFFSQASYLTKMKMIRAQKKQEKIDQDNLSQSEEEMPDQQKFGITHYKDLKKHPKLLNYTMSLIRSREKSVDDIENIRKQSIKENLRMSINNMSQIASLNDSQNTQAQFRPSKIIDPEEVMDDKIRKIYARHKSDKLSPSAKNNSRCLNIMAKQNKILGKCNGKLSKEQAKKLKSRFNEIVNEMYKSERKRKDSLPRIIEQ